MARLAAQYVKSLKLKPELRERVLTEIRNNLARISVKKGRFVDSSTTFNALWSSNKLLTGPLAETAAVWIDDFPLMRFVQDEIGRELAGEPYKSDIDNESIRSFDIFRDIDISSDYLLKSFETLPWHYVATLRLNGDVAPYLQDTEAFSISKDVKLVRGSRLEQSHPIEGAASEIRERLFRRGAGLLQLGTPEPRWDDNALYIQVNV